MEKSERKSYSLDLSDFDLKIQDADVIENYTDLRVYMPYANKHDLKSRSMVQTKKQETLIRTLALRSSFNHCGVQQQKNVFLRRH